MPPAPKHIRRWSQFSLGTLFVVMTSVVILCAGLLSMFILVPGPEAQRIAKKAQAVYDARQAGIQVDGDELEAAGWKPGDDMATIRRKLGRQSEEKATR